MLCSSPYWAKGLRLEEWPCGKCLPCKFNSRRIWTGRLLQESHLHQSSFFCTFTYNKENYPHDASVSVREAQLLLKRIRKNAAPDPLRYFLVGEYGSRTWRAHYHAILFGLRDPVAAESAWQKGFVQSLPFSYELAQYIAGYAVKGMTNANDPRLGGRHPEFARMSLRPGIGAGAADAILGALVDPETGEIRMEHDVPHVVRAAGKLWPLGRYIRNRVRVGLGMEPREPAAAAAARKQSEREKWPVVSAVKEEDPKEQRRLQDSRSAAVRDSINKLRRSL